MRHGAEVLIATLGIAVMGGGCRARPAPEYIRLEGPAPSLAEAPGSRALLVVFWASWCAPCKASFPMMAALHQSFAARGLVIVAVSVDEKPAAAAEFARKLAPPFATLHDRSQSLVKQVAVPVMPPLYPGKLWLVGISAARLVPLCSTRTRRRKRAR